MPQASSLFLFAALGFVGLKIYENRQRAKQRALDRAELRAYMRGQF